MGCAWLRKAGCAGGPLSRGKAGLSARRAALCLKDGPRAAGAPSGAKRRPYFGFPKSTFGATFAVSGAWKSGYSLKLNTAAVMFAGKLRRDVL